MKRTVQVQTLFLICLVVAASAAAAQVKPDLVVSHVGISADATGQLIGKVSVTVMNMCPGSVATGSYLLLTFKSNQLRDAKTIYYVGNRIPTLRGRESYTQTFDTTSARIGVGKYIVAEADPYRKVAESNEENNWRTLYPDGAANASEACSAKR